MPITKTGNFYGVLYAEHRHTGYNSDIFIYQYSFIFYYLFFLQDHAFTLKRLHTLQMLTSQAAISLDNARMILELNRVTSELRAQCEKLKALDELKVRQNMKRTFH
jgi:GAF domain-containing protein